MKHIDSSNRVRLVTMINPEMEKWIREKAENEATTVDQLLRDMIREKME